MNFHLSLLLTGLLDGLRPKEENEKRQKQVLCIITKYCVNYEICSSLKQNNIETCVALKTNKYSFRLHFKQNASFKRKTENNIVSP